MRIAVNSRLLVPHKTDGIARFTLETFKRITKSHPEHHFTFIFDRNFDQFNFGPNSENVSLFPPARHPILWYIWFEHRLKAFLNKGNFDLFVSPEGWVPGALKMPSLAVIHDLNFIHLPENVAPSHRKYLQHYFPKYTERANRIATVSEYSMNDLIATLGVAKENIDVVYNGVNEIFKPSTTDVQNKIKKKYNEGKNYFLFVGTLHPRKNLDHLFLAFDRFKKESGSNTKLLIVGNRKWWPNELEKIFQSLDHKSDIEFLGRIEDEELSEIIASSSALTYIPHFEGFGIPILEAFACETAVITANNTSLPEVAGEAAILCNSKDIDQVAKAMQKIDSDPLYRDELIQLGRLRLQNFNWDLTAGKLWQSMIKTISS